MKFKILIPVFICLFLGLISCDGYNKLLKSTNYELKFQKAKEYYDKKDYVRSSQLYEELIPITRGSDKAEDVYYFFAWSEYLMGDNILSQYHFKTFARNYPNSPRAEECAYMNAYCFYLNSPNYKLDQTSTKNAVKEFQSFVDTYPNSKRIDSINILIDNLNQKLETKDYEIIKQYYKLEYWKSAIVAAKNFFKEYPSSRFNEELSFDIIDSYYLLAQNSIRTKREERLNAVMENYVKFIDLYPKSSYLSRAENIYNNSIKQKEKLQNE